MLVCLECGYVFCDGNEERWIEGRGEYNGSSCREEMRGCPICHGHYDEAVQCVACHGWYAKSELNVGVCEGCADDYKSDFDFSYKISKEICEKDKTFRSEVKLLDIFSEIFCAEEIDAILYDYAKKNPDKIKTHKYAETYPDWFCEKICEEVKKNENGKN